MIGDVPWETLKEYVFDPLSGANVESTEDIDLESIMIYPNYALKQTTQRIANYELSVSDIAFIGLLYPKNAKLPTIQEAWVDAGFFVWRTKENTSWAAWVDGMIALKITELGAKQESFPDVSDGEQLNSTKFMFCPNDDGRSFVSTSPLKRAPMFNTSNVKDFTWMFSET